MILNHELEGKLYIVLQQPSYLHCIVMYQLVCPCFTSHFQRNEHLWLLSFSLTKEDKLCRSLNVYCIPSWFMELHSYRVCPFCVEERELDIHNQIILENSSKVWDHTKLEIGVEFSKALVDSMFWKNIVVLHTSAHNSFVGNSFSRIMHIISITILLHLSLTPLCSRV